MRSMHFRHSLVFVLLIFLISPIHAKSSESSQQLYPPKDIDGMIDRLKAEGDKRRVMIKPYQLSFKAELMSELKQGEYSLIYDGLQFWGIDPMPEVTHSIYVKTPGGKVIGVYVEKEAATGLAKENVGAQAELYALHVYNYEHGPRLLIVSYKALSHEPE